MALLRGYAYLTPATASPSRPRTDPKRPPNTQSLPTIAIPPFAPAPPVHAVRAGHCAVCDAGFQDKARALEYGTFNGDGTRTYMSAAFASSPGLGVNRGPRPPPRQGAAPHPHGAATIQM